MMTAERLVPDDNLIISTGRLRLTPITVADADDLVPVLNSKALYRFIGGQPPTLDELRERFARWQHRRSPDGEQLWLNWIVRLIEDRKAVG